MAPPHMRRPAALARGEPCENDETGNSQFSEAKSTWQVPAPSPVELCWLRSQGVSRVAIVSPWPVGATNVTFHGRTCELDAGGERVLTFLVEDCGELIDIAAWQLAIGQAAIFNPATYFAGNALLIHETALQWLRANREGIVIVRPDMSHAYLANCQRFACSDAAHARQIVRWLHPPKPTVAILVEVPAERAAA
jgi:hypothetical protein